jgi:2-dehydropantoate 2-reductase
VLIVTERHEGEGSVTEPASTPSGERRVAVVGAGAVGTALAAWFARGGQWVLACAPRAPGRATVRLDTGDGPVEHSVSWHTDPSTVDGPVDWVFLTTKIHHTPATKPWLASLIGPGTRVVAAQNGVDHRERLAPLTDAPVVPALVYFNAERIDLGSVRVRRTGRDLVFPDDPDGQAAAQLSKENDIAAHIEPDFTTAAWQKLLINATANPLTALTGRRVEVLREPAIAELAHSIAKETAVVAASQGARLSPDAPDAALAWLRQVPSGTTSSMLQDRQAGRPLELDGLTGTVIRLGRRAGVATPVTDVVRALLSTAQF